MHAITVDEIRERADLVIVATRAQDFETGLDVCASAIGDETIVLPIIEGVRHAELAAKAVAPRVLVGVLEARTSLDADGILMRLVQ